MSWLITRIVARTAKNTCHRGRSASVFLQPGNPRFCLGFSYASSFPLILVSAKGENYLLEGRDILPLLKEDWCCVNFS